MWPPSIGNGGGASNVTMSSATVNANLSSMGGLPTVVCIYWGPSDGSMNAAAWSNVVNLGVMSVGPFSTNITGLVSGDLYYYRCWASNSVGVAWAQASTNFFSPLGPPVVDNDGGASNVTVGSATLN